MGEACSCSCGAPSKKEGYITLSPEKFAKAIESPTVYLVDVRTSDEFATGHIKDAHNIDVQKEDFLELAKETLPKDKEIAVYCGSGKRSAMAADKLSAAGYDIINLDGGLAAWKEASLPVV